MVHATDSEEFGPVVVEGVIAVDPSFFRLALSRLLSNSCHSPIS